MNKRQYQIQILEDELGFSLENVIEASKIKEGEWRMVVEHIFDYINDKPIITNVYDKNFYELIDYLWNTSSNDIEARILEEVAKLNKLSYKDFTEYFNKFTFWGSLDIEKGDYTAITNRANILKQHSFDFIWLYRHLEDYDSKMTLYGILKNWAILDFNVIETFKSSWPDYFDPNIFDNNINDVFVDCGAYNGDTILEYIKSYGTNYKTIYAYEIMPDSWCKCIENVKEFPNIYSINKGTGNVNEIKSIEINVNSASANKLSDKGTINVEVVRLDEDIKEEVSFIKMDIEGGEKDALFGASNIIKRNHPKLAISIYHGYEDLYAIPYIIYKMKPGYKMYLRHSGGSLIPTEFSLLCKWSDR